MTADLRSHPENKPTIGRHGFSSACANAGFASQLTFSIGIFPYEKASSKKGIRRGAVVYRIKAYLPQREQAFARAEEVAKLLDAGTEFKKKNETLKV